MGGDSHTEWVRRKAMTQASTLLARAHSLAQAGQLEQAEEKLTEHLAQNPDSADAHYQRSCLNLQRGQFAKAQLDLRAALTIAPGNPIYLNDLALSYEHTADLRQAEETYRQAVQEPKTFPPAFFNYAAFVRKRNRFDEAEDLLRKGLALAPQFQPGLRMLGNLLRHRRDWAQSRFFLEQAVALNSQDYTAHFQLGALEMSIGSFAAAAENFDRALAIDPSRTDAYLNLGTSRQEVADLDGALQAYRSALSLDPSLFYTVAKKLVSASKGTLWLRGSELRRQLLGD